MWTKLALSSKKFARVGDDGYLWQCGSYFSQTKTYRGGNAAEAGACHVHAAQLPAYVICIDGRDKFAELFEKPQRRVKKFVRPQAPLIYSGGSPVILQMWKVLRPKLYCCGKRWRSPRPR